jgi:hypothetical protein
MHMSMMCKCNITTSHMLQHVLTYTSHTQEELPVTVAKQKSKRAHIHAHSPPPKHTHTHPHGRHRSAHTHRSQLFDGLQRILLQYVFHDIRLLLKLDLCAQTRSKSNTRLASGSQIACSNWLSQSLCSVVLSLFHASSVYTCTALLLILFCFL